MGCWHTSHFSYLQTWLQYFVNYCFLKHLRFLGSELYFQNHIFSLQNYIFHQKVMEQYCISLAYQMADTKKVSFMLKNGAFFTYYRLLFFWKKKGKEKNPKSLIFFLISTFSINAHNSSFTTSSDFQSSMTHFILYIKQYMFMSNSKKSHKIFTRALKPKLTYNQELLLT